MPIPPVPKAKLSVIATLPKEYFLENLAVRHDNPLIASDMTRKRLWLVPPAGEGETVEPALLASFGQPTLCMIEVEPDVFWSPPRTFTRRTSATCTGWTCTAGARANLPTSRRCCVSSPWLRLSTAAA